MKLVYAITMADAVGAASAGVLGEALAHVSAGGVAAIVGEVEETPAIEAPMLRAYDRVLRELAAQNDAILPSRFGVTLPDEVSLRDMLSAREGDLARALALVKGREQMTLRVFGEPMARGLDAGDSTMGPGARYLHGRKRALGVPEIEPLRVALADLVRAEKTTRHDAPPLLATVAHLIDRGANAAYRALVGTIRLDVTCSVSGPWPPYAFAPEVWS